jgi:hypothetical protein
VVFDDIQHPLPQVQELIEAAWPKQKDRVARAILAIALKHGGLDLADGSTVSRANLAKREYHHLFPDAFLKRRRYEDQRIYRSLNCAVVTWKTNRNISDKDPEKYLAERREGSSLGEAEVRTRLASHLIPFDELVAGDYEAFLTARADLVHNAMNARGVETRSLQHVGFDASASVPPTFVIYGVVKPDGTLRHSRLPSWFWTLTPCDSSATSLCASNVPMHESGEKVSAYPSGLSLNPVDFRTAELCSARAPVHSKN